MRTVKIPAEAVANWLAYGERGLSSEAIVKHLTDVGGGIANDDHPYDPSDFRRCELLLRQAPLLRLVFHQMAQVSPRWESLVEHWDEIANVIEEEVPGVFESRPPGTVNAPRGYALIRECRR